MEERVNTSLTAGALVRGEIRRKLERIKLHDLLDSWSEQKGWLDSEFYITGIDGGVWESLVEWMEEVMESKR